VAVEVAVETQVVEAVEVIFIHQLITFPQEQRLYLHRVVEDQEVLEQVLQEDHQRLQLDQKRSQSLEVRVELQMEVEDQVITAEDEAE
jgi:hypothetical protein